MHQLILYIDPGSGSYLVQVIIGAVLSGLFFFKTFWYRVKAFFTKRKPAEDDPTHSD